MTCIGLYLMSNALKISWNVYLNMKLRTVKETGKVKTAVTIGKWSVEAGDS